MLISATCLNDKLLYGIVKVGRGKLLQGTEDTYEYLAWFRIPEFKNGRALPPVKFIHVYSDGIIVLDIMARLALLKKYPELRAGRPGVPRNRWRCRHCGDIIWSKYRHDYVTCHCGRISTDGGYDYVHQRGKPSDFERLPEVWEQTIAFKKALRDTLPKRKALKKAVKRRSR